MLIPPLQTIALLLTRTPSMMNTSLLQTLHNHHNLLSSTPPIICTRFVTSETHNLLRRPRTGNNYAFLVSAAQHHLICANKHCQTRVLAHAGKRVVCAPIPSSSHPIVSITSLHTHTPHNINRILCSPTDTGTLPLQEPALNQSRSAAVAAHMTHGFTCKKLPCLCRSCANLSLQRLSCQSVHTFLYGCLVAVLPVLIRRTCILASTSQWN